MRALAAVIALISIAVASCSRENASPSGSPSPSATASVSASAAPAAANDGTDPKSPVLAPDDVTFTDTRKGLGWGDRCFNEIKQAKWGWARAACDRGLALPEVDPKTRPLLLYNAGLIAKHAGDGAAARNYFEQSLALRSPTDPGRTVVEKELVSVGGQAPAGAQTKTFPCGKLRCRADQICCPGGPPGTESCVAYNPDSPDFCRLTFRMCDQSTNEPCVPPERCKPGQPPQVNLMCSR